MKAAGILGTRSRSFRLDASRLDEDEENNVYVKDVGYISGAAILLSVRRELESGGSSYVAFALPLPASPDLAFAG